MQGILSHCDKCLAAESEFSTLTLSISPPRIPIPVRTPPLTTMVGMPMPLNKCHYIVKCILAP